MVRRRPPRWACTGSEAGSMRQRSSHWGLLLPCLLLLVVLPSRAVAVSILRPDGDHSLELDIPPSPCPFLHPLLLDSPPSAEEAGADTDLQYSRSDRRGYYGQEVGYGSYFPVGIDPLTVLAGLAFLAFIIQTLYLLLYKNYGLGLGVGAGVGVGPLSADRHQREEEAVWNDQLASRITTYGSNKSEEAESSLSAQLRSTSGYEKRYGDVSPFEAMYSLIRRIWAARSCGSSWLCKIIHFARLLIEPINKIHEKPAIS